MKEIERNKLPYRDGVGIMLINDIGNIFVGKRIDSTSDAWQMPQGGIDDGETAEIAAIRELGEEVGTENAKIIAAFDEWLYYDLPDRLIPKIWNGKYRGQRQKWFLMQFLGSDDEINIATKHPEFMDWRWAEPENLVDLIVPFKRDIYTKLVSELYILRK